MQHDKNAGLSPQTVELAFSQCIGRSLGPPLSNSVAQNVFHLLNGLRAIESEFLANVEPCIQFSVENSDRYRGQHEP